MRPLLIDALLDRLRHHCITIRIGTEIKGTPDRVDSNEFTSYDVYITDHKGRGEQLILKWIRLAKLLSANCAETFSTPACSSMVATATSSGQVIERPTRR
jgi:hypothetical protein